MFSLLVLISFVLSSTVDVVSVTVLDIDVICVDNPSACVFISSTDVSSSLTLSVIAVTSEALLTTGTICPSAMSSLKFPEAV